MKVTSFEISKKLVEIGFNTEAEFFWVEKQSGITKPYLAKDDYDFPVDYRFKAYDLETILEALPERIDFDNEDRAHFSMDHHNIGYYKQGMFLHEFSTFSLIKENKADYAAHLLILLHEKGLINFKGASNESN